MRKREAVEDSAIYAAMADYRPGEDSGQSSLSILPANQLEKDVIPLDMDFSRVDEGELEPRFLANDAALDLELEQDRRETSQQKGSLSDKQLDGGTDLGDDSEAELLADGSAGARRMRYEVLSSILATERCFWKISSMINDGDNPKSPLEVDQFEQGELEVLLSGASRLPRLGFEVEAMFLRYEEQTRKEKRDLEIRMQGLTEENSDISNLLRIALMEKEAAEKSLNKLKGISEQKRTAILQIAEWGLQKAGLGFMMGGSIEESPIEQSINCNSCMTSYVSDCEEDEINLGAAVKKVVKNLRHEITDLRCSLEEKRFENERLKSLTENQMEELADRALRIKVLEERENTLDKNVEELAMKLKRAEHELVRQIETSESEAEAWKTEISECQTEIAILKEDLKKTEADLNACSNRLKMKEKLAETAIAAHSAIETSLRLADSRSVGLREAIEELTKQLEEEADRSSGRRRVRHICWPWGALRLNPTAAAAVIRKKAV